MLELSCLFVQLFNFAGSSEPKPDTSASRDLGSAKAEFVTTAIVKTAERTLREGMSVVVVGRCNEWMAG